jgi:ABC-type Zn2+ transport system substrate-binding protein/surface adhesin
MLEFMDQALINLYDEEPTCKDLQGIRYDNFIMDEFDEDDDDDDDDDFDDDDDETDEYDEDDDFDDPYDDWCDEEE